MCSLRRRRIHLLLFGVHGLFLNSHHHNHYRCRRRGEEDYVAARTSCSSYCVCNHKQCTLRLRNEERARLKVEPNPKNEVCDSTRRVKHKLSLMVLVQYNICLDTFYSWIPLNFPDHSIILRRSKRTRAYFDPPAITEWESSITQWRGKCMLNLVELHMYTK